MHATGADPPGNTGDWTVLERDRALAWRDLAGFVPPRAFDAHAHLYRLSDFGGHVPPLCALGPDPAGLDAYCQAMGAILPGCRLSGLFFGFPAPGVDVEAANAFAATEARQDPDSCALMLVRPDTDPEFIRESARRQGFLGLKCYHVFSQHSPTFQAPLRSYLPEAQVQVAHEEHLLITIHLVRSQALADAENQETLRSYALRYPEARLILAHAARGFNPYHAAAGFDALRGLHNVWCDTSAVTESGALEAAIRALGPDRLLFGTDFPVSHQRGRCVAVGDSFLWLTAANTSFGAPYGDVHPTLVGIEALRALKLACANQRLSDTQVDAIFWENAAHLFGLRG